MKARQDFVGPCRPKAAQEFHEGIFDAKNALAFEEMNSWVDRGCPVGQFWWKMDM